MPSAKRIDLLLAIAHFAVDYHSGQFSRGYRLWCLCERRLRRYGIRNPLIVGLNSRRQKAIYSDLERTYADKM